MWQIIIHGMRLFRLFRSSYRTRSTHRSLVNIARSAEILLLFFSLLPLSMATPPDKIPPPPPMPQPNLNTEELAVIRQIMETFMQARQESIARGRTSVLQPQLDMPSTSASASASAHVSGYSPLHDGQAFLVPSGPPLRKRPRDGSKRRTSSTSSSTDELPEPSTCEERALAQQTREQRRERAACLNPEGKRRAHYTTPYGIALAPCQLCSMAGVLTSAAGSPYYFICPNCNRTGWRPQIAGGAWAEGVREKVIAHRRAWENAFITVCQQCRNPVAPEGMDSLFRYSYSTISIGTQTDELSRYPAATPQLLIDVTLARTSEETRRDNEIVEQLVTYMRNWFDRVLRAGGEVEDLYTEFRGHMHVFFTNGQDLRLATGLWHAACQRAKSFYTAREVFPLWSTRTPSTRRFAVTLLENGLFQAATNAAGIFSILPVETAATQEAPIAGNLMDTTGNDSPIDQTRAEKRDAAQQSRLDIRAKRFGLTPTMGGRVAAHFTSASLMLAPSARNGLHLSLSRATPSSNGTPGPSSTSQNRTATPARRVTSASSSASRAPASSAATAEAPRRPSTKEKTYRVKASHFFKDDSPPPPPPPRI